MRDLMQIITDKKILTKNVINAFNDSSIIKNLPFNYVSKSGFTKKDILEKIENMSNCCNSIVKKVYDNGDEKIITGNHCQNPSICPLCSAKVQSTRRGRLLPKVKSACAKYHHCYKIVFTIADSPDLAGMIRNLKNYLRRFRKMGQKRKKGFSQGEWSKVKAGFMSIEVKRGKNSGLWHVHAHCIVWCSNLIDYSIYDEQEKQNLFEIYGKNNVPKELMSLAEKGDYKIYSKLQDKNINVSKLQYEWNMSTDRNGSNIECERVKKIPTNVNYQKKYINMTYSQSVAEQCKEILKYDFKYNDFNSENDFFDVLTETRGSRFLSTFGDFRKIEYDRIIIALKKWLKLPSVEHATWILKNTDLRNISGKKEKLKLLLNEMIKNEMTDIQINRIFKFYKLDREILSEYEEPDLLNGKKCTFIFNEKLQKYESCTVSSIPKNGIGKQERAEINKITGNYRKNRNKILNKNIGNSTLYKILNNLKTEMRYEIQLIRELFSSQRGLSAPIRPNTLKIDVRTYYQTAF